VVLYDCYSILNACTFTLNGEGFILNSPSEFTRFSLSAQRICKPKCSVNIKQGARPAVPLNSLTTRPMSSATQIATAGGSTT